MPLFAQVTHRECHLEGVHDLELGVLDALLPGELVGASDLLRGERDARDLGICAQFLFLREREVCEHK